MFLITFYCLTSLLNSTTYSAFEVIVVTNSALAETVDLEGRVDSVMAGTGAVFSLIPPENATGNFVKVVQRVPVKIVFTNLDEKRTPLPVGTSVEPTILVEEDP